MKRIIFSILTISTLMFSSCCKNQEKTDGKVLYQVNPLDGLMQGYYDGNMTVGEFKSHGDFGIGTFNQVNGELIELDGVVYQALYDGSVVTAGDEVNIPFGVTTRFETTSAEDYAEVKSFEDLSEKILACINSQNPNALYAVKVHGTFDSIKVRSELPQQKPYRNLAEALKTDQREFTYENLPGTLVIMYNPHFMGQINSHGLHMHFVSDDKSKGGHVLALSGKNLHGDFDKIPGFKMILSDDEEFSRVNFSKDMTEVTRYAELNK